MRGLFLVLLCALAVVLAGPDYRYSAVQVHGDPGPGLAQRLSLLGSPEIPAFLVPIREMTRDILKSEPSIEALLARPVHQGNLQLLVTLVPRVPAARIQRGKHFFYLDRTGTIFPGRGLSFPGVPPPLIELSGGGRLFPGAVLSSPIREQVFAYLALHNQGRAPSPRFARAVLESSGNWKLWTEDGISVEAGRSEGLQDRLRIVFPLLKVIREKKLGAASIDVRNGRVPVVRLKSPARRVSGRAL